ncbi:hypothetical protein KOW79_017434 [Hemibagrus wyckioides]|uniref:Uncharacterized protein n=1 Tax=Hemibagrus wyckioides TaxID=337641 RepID=A0A9D3NDC8_9TELE|nr:hypothetical protein KOW79_017434 [Hemibagrus wyckioides]
MAITEHYMDFQQKRLTYCYYKTRPLLPVLLVKLQKIQPCDFSVKVPLSFGLTRARRANGQHQQAHIMPNFVCTVTETLQSPDMIASPAGGLGLGLLCFVEKKHSVKLFNTLEQQQRSEVNDVIY